MTFSIDATTGRLEKGVGPGHRFCVVKSCGCVLAQQVLAEITGDKCLACGKIFVPDDVIELIGTPEVVESLKEKLLLKRSKEPKAKKRKKPKTEGSAEKKSKAAAASTARPKVLPSVAIPKKVDVPKFADVSVYKSLFRSDTEKKVKETFLCRNV
eukprot:TRINITY_DN40277_c0_g1_i4.p1 TRINITY_DN40277_c0_g1~~TRINITY_DN40277_c0_g1_i4.p1  ORF type:complete len:162 (-),score=11.88 TRINITY_DN40277_c0_g1_i4:109-573(-)